MAVSFRIFPTRGLVYVRYEGFVDLESTFLALSEYAQHPNYAPGQKQLVDLSRITDYERDFARIMSVQARKVDIFAGNALETMFMYYVDSAISRDMARTILRSWEGIDSVVARVQDHEGSALQLLGLPETNFDDLLALPETG